MTTTSYSAEAANLADTPTTPGLVTLMNAILAPLLTTSFENASFTSQKEGRTLGNALKLDLVGVSGATAMANPFTIQAFVASTDAALVAMINAYAVANPAAFISQIFKQYLRAPRATQQVIGIVFVNPVYADGSTHFAAGAGGGGGGGPPTGAAGGDLSGTYPNPLVGPVINGKTTSGSLAIGATSIYSVPLATATSLTAEITLKKGTTYYQTTFTVNANDGTTPAWGETNITIGPPIGGTFDCPLTATITAGNLNIVCTPASTGWAAETRIRQFS